MSKHSIIFNNQQRINQTVSLSHVNQYQPLIHHWSTILNHQPTISQPLANHYPAISQLSIHHYLIINLPLFRSNQPTIIQNLTNHWQTINELLTNYKSTIDHLLTNHQITIKQPFTNNQPTINPSIDSLSFFPLSLYSWQPSMFLWPWESTAILNHYSDLTDHWLTII